VSTYVLLTNKQIYTMYLNYNINKNQCNKRITPHPSLSKREYILKVPFAKGENERGFYGYEICIFYKSGYN